MADDESTTRLFRRWQAGEEAAATQIVERYSQRLCALAERSIDGRLRPRIEAEDVIQSVFRTFFRRSSEGEFRIDRRGDLWRLLARITMNRVIKRAVREKAQRRDGRREVLTDPGVLDWVAVDDPTPADVAELDDELQQLLDELQPNAAAIVRARLAGKGIEETAVATGCSRWTVSRTIDRVNSHLQRRLLGGGE